MPFSFHSHSGQFCRHAKGTLEEVVLAAIQKGFRVYGLTEHVPRYRTCDLYPEEVEADMTVEDLEKTFEEFVTEARRLRDKYREKITLLIGAETEYIVPEDAKKSNHLKHVYSLDYLVGSVHHIQEIPLDFDLDTFERCLQAFDHDNEKLIAAYFDAQYEMLYHTRPLVVGHIDLVRLWRSHWRFEEENWKRVERNIDFVIGYGGIFEINSRAWKKGLPDAYPFRDVLKCILEKGGRITISDDSHGPGDVGMHYDKLFTYLKEMGINSIHYLNLNKEGKTVIQELTNLDGDAFWTKLAQW
ncbi:uncharacterized protein VTP21DRAFT_9848 [Calcarisporiella thermophila]|uniref:uncharacterized protein n=1 Tax=Calcarisporiella thermophila TaxID=911321 RepID=UPI003743A339